MHRGERAQWPGRVGWGPALFLRAWPPPAVGMCAAVVRAGFGKLAGEGCAHGSASCGRQAPPGRGRCPVPAPCGFILLVVKSAVHCEAGENPTRPQEHSRRRVSSLFIRFTCKAEGKAGLPSAGSLPQCLRQPEPGQAAAPSRSALWVAGARVLDPTPLPSGTCISRSLESGTGP